MIRHKGAGHLFLEMHWNALYVSIKSTQITVKSLLLFTKKHHPEGKPPLSRKNASSVPFMFWSCRISFAGPLTLKHISVMCGCAVQSVVIHSCNRIDVFTRASTNPISIANFGSDDVFDKCNLICIFLLTLLVTKPTGHVYSNVHLF